MPNYNYDDDFKIARETEQEVANLLTKSFGFTFIEFERTNKYDLLLEKDSKRWKIEIKEDFTLEKTGNVGLEFECRGKPSGISVTESDFYIYKLHTKMNNVFLAIRTNELKKMIAGKAYWRIVSGGDPGSNSKNYLFRYETFVKHGKILTLTIP